MSDTDGGTPHDDTWWMKAFVYAVVGSFIIARYIHFAVFGVLLIIGGYHLYQNPADAQTLGKMVGFSLLAAGVIAVFLIVVGAVGVYVGKRLDPNLPLASWEVEDDWE